MLEKLIRRLFPTYCTERRSSASNFPISATASPTTLPNLSFTVSARALPIKNASSMPKLSVAEKDNKMEGTCGG